VLDFLIFYLRRTVTTLCISTVKSYGDVATLTWQFTTCGFPRFVHFRSVFPVVPTAWSCHRNDNAVTSASDNVTCFGPWRPVGDERILTLITGSTRFAKFSLLTFFRISAKQQNSPVALGFWDILYKLGAYVLSHSVRRGKFPVLPLILNFRCISTVRFFYGIHIRTLHAVHFLLCCQVEHLAPTLRLYTSSEYKDVWVQKAMYTHTHVCLGLCTQGIIYDSGNNSALRGFCDSTPALT
jgi:hypothetical protein